MKTQLHELEASFAETRAVFEYRYVVASDRLVDLSHHLGRWLSKRITGNARTTTLNRILRRPRTAHEERNFDAIVARLNLDQTPMRHISGLNDSIVELTGEL